MYGKTDTCAKIQEVEATDPDTEAEADKNVVVDASRRPLTVDPFSAEDERIIAAFEEIGKVG